MGSAPGASYSDALTTVADTMWRSSHSAPSSSWCSSPCKTKNSHLKEDLCFSSLYLQSRSRSHFLVDWLEHTVNHIFHGHDRISTAPPESELRPRWAGASCPAAWHELAWGAHQCDSPFKWSWLITPFELKVWNTTRVCQNVVDTWCLNYLKPEVGLSHTYLSHFYLNNQSKTLPLLRGDKKCPGLTRSCCGCTISRVFKMYVLHIYQACICSTNVFWERLSSKFFLQRTKGLILPLYRDVNYGMFVLNKDLLQCTNKYFMRVVLMILVPHELLPLLSRD